MRWWAFGCAGIGFDQPGGLPRPPALHLGQPDPGAAVRTGEHGMDRAWLSQQDAVAMLMKDQPIPIDAIYVPTKRRATLDPATVAKLAESTQQGYAGDTHVEGAAIFRAEWDNLRAAMQQALALAQRSGDVYLGAGARAALGLLELTLGRPPEAAEILLEITAPRRRLPRMLLRVYLAGLVPCLSRLNARHSDSQVLWRYYWDTIDACVPPPRVLQAMEQAGFAHVTRHTELVVFSEYTGRKG